jgi:integration host factor subunit beta
MNKSDLAEELSRRAGIVAKQAAIIVDLVFDEMNAELVKGERIEIRGFGSFAVKKYGAYVGRNPKTKASIEVPPKRLPYFKVGKELRARIAEVTPPDSKEAVG